MFPHYPGHRLAEKEQPLQVEVHNGVPGAFPYVQRGIHHRVGSSIVHQDINPPKPRLDLLDQIIYLLQPTHMRRYCQRFPAQSLYLFSYPLQVRKFPAGYRHVCPRSGKPQGSGLSNAAATAAYQSHFTFEREIHFLIQPGQHHVVPGFILDKAGGGQAPALLSVIGSVYDSPHESPRVPLSSYSSLING
ncbi:MAG: hypothetical protein DDT25_01292 [Chloroflexi bacterium]|nr:hypothetical protein [Chloroflexota bacterium]